MLSAALQGGGVNVGGSPPVKGEPTTHRAAAADPLNPGSEWPAESREVVWEQLTAWSGAQFSLAGTGSRL